MVMSGFTFSMRGYLFPVIDVARRQGSNPRLSPANSGDWRVLAHRPCLLACGRDRIDSNVTATWETGWESSTAAAGLDAVSNEDSTPTSAVVKATLYVPPTLLLGKAAIWRQFRGAPEAL
ncbi:hypothetical protein O988_09315 [Pseudogymnoascus sp. VKM F-3808]|nr:hypothetical protein O988_09315 [Pseudogymnoascus sp. VKM F-3808]